MVIIMLSLTIKSDWGLSGSVLDVSIVSRYCLSATDMLNDCELHKQFVNLITDISGSRIVFEHYETKVRIATGRDGGPDSLAVTCTNTDTGVSSSVYCTSAEIRIRENMETVIECKSMVDDYVFTVGFFTLGFLS